MYTKATIDGVCSSGLSPSYPRRREFDCRKVSLILFSDAPGDGDGERVGSVPGV